MTLLLFLPIAFSSREKSPAADLDSQLIQDFIHLLRLDPNLTLFIKEFMFGQDFFDCCLRIRIFVIGVHLDSQPIEMVVHEVVCAEVLRSRVQETDERWIGTLPFCEMVIRIGQPHFFHHCLDFCVGHGASYFSAFSMRLWSSSTPSCSAGAMCGLAATRPPPRLACPFSKRCANWYRSLEWTTIWRLWLDSSCFVATQLDLYRPVRDGAPVSICSLTVLADFRTARLTSKDASFAYVRFDDSITLWELDGNSCCIANISIYPANIGATIALICPTV